MHLRRLGDCHKSVKLRQGEPGIIGAAVKMARKRKKRVFTAGKETRRLAREGIGSPQPARVIPDKRKKPPRHKKSVTEQEI